MALLVMLFYGHELWSRFGVAVWNDTRGREASEFSKDGRFRSVVPGVIVACKHSAVQEWTCSRVPREMRRCVRGLSRHFEDGRLGKTLPRWQRSRQSLCFLRQKYNSEDLLRTDRVHACGRFRIGGKRGRVVKGKR